MDWKWGCCLLPWSTIHRPGTSLTKTQYMGSCLSLLRPLCSYWDTQYSCPSIPVIFHNEDVWRRVGHGYCDFPGNPAPTSYCYSYKNDFFFFLQALSSVLRKTCISLLFPSEYVSKTLQNSKMTNIPEISWEQFYTCSVKMSYKWTFSPSSCSE